MGWSTYQWAPGTENALVEQGDDATQTVTTFGPGGIVVATAPYTTAQVAQMQSEKASAAAQTAVVSAQSVIDTLFTQQPALQSQLETDITSVANWDGLTSAERAAIMGRVLQDGLANAMQAIVAHITVTGNNPNVS